MTPPLVFEPLFMERIWGGRRLGDAAGQEAASPGCASASRGKSWIARTRRAWSTRGCCAGSRCTSCGRGQRETVFGPGLADTPRFPLLFKILDAQDRLSVQVHPPAAVAAAAGRRAEDGDVVHPRRAARQRSLRGAQARCDARGFRGGAARRHASRRRSTASRSRRATPCSSRAGASTPSARAI